MSARWEHFKIKAVEARPELKLGKSAFDFALLERSLGPKDKWYATATSSHAPSVLPSLTLSHTHPLACLSRRGAQSGRRTKAPSSSFCC